MAQEHLEFEGEVVESIRGIVTVSVLIGGNETFIKCHIGGKMKKYKINVLVSDLVRIRVSPYDLTRGIVFHREKKNPNH